MDENRRRNMGGGGEDHIEQRWPAERGDDRAQPVNGYQ